MGEDRCAEFATDKFDAIAVRYDPDTRVAYHAQVERARQANAAARDAALTAFAGTKSELKLLDAVATRGGGRGNQHFGRACEF